MKRFGPATFILVLLTLVLAAPGWATTNGDGFMIGVLAPYNTFAGDFDGMHFFNAGEEILLVPMMEKALGYGISVGRRKGNMDSELYYIHSAHDYSFELIRDKASFDAAGVNSRFFFGRSGMIRPYANIGVDFCWVKAKNASATLYAPIRTGDVKFTGLGLFGGAGIGISPVKAVTLYVGGDLRWGLFGRGKGVLNQSHKLDKLNSLSLCLRSGLIFVI
jgi:opacity protein-like surface antigen